MAPVTVTVRRHAAATPERAFDVIGPIDLTSVFKGYGPLPAVIGTSGMTGTWDHAGVERTVQLKGGAIMSERLTEVTRPGVFAYEVTPVRGPLVLIVDHIIGRFEFAASATGSGTEITWSYGFVPKPGGRLALRTLAPIWRRYAERVLKGCVAAVEAPH